VELEPQVLRDEREWCVFGGPNLVPWVLGNRVAIVVLELVRERDIEEDLPRGRTAVGAVYARGIIYGWRATGLALPERFGTAGCPLFLRRRLPIVQLSQERETLYSAALDRQLPRRPSRPLHRVLWPGGLVRFFRFIRIHEEEGIAGRARSTLTFRQAGRNWPLRCSVATAIAVVAKSRAQGGFRRSRLVREGGG